MSLLYFSFKPTETSFPYIDRNIILSYQDGVPDSRRTCAHPFQTLLREAYQDGVPDSRQRGAYQDGVPDSRQREAYQDGALGSRGRYGEKLTRMGFQTVGVHTERTLPGWGSRQ